MMFQLYEEMLVLLKNTLEAIEKAYEDGKMIFQQPFLMVVQAL